MIKTYSTYLQKKKKIQETQMTTGYKVQFIMLELFGISLTMLKENHIEYIDLEYTDSLYLYKNKIKSRMDPILNHSLALHLFKTYK